MAHLQFSLKKLVQKTVNFIDFFVSRSRTFLIKIPNFKILSAIGKVLGIERHRKYKNKQLPALDMQKFDKNINKLLWQKRNRKAT
jgi:hypothetical protein